MVVGTEKGSLLFFNRKSQRKIPCISKHGKKVTFGDWSSEGNLISCSADRMLTVSDQTGNTLYDSFIVKGDPTNIRWNPFKEANNEIVCCILSNSKVMYFNPKTQAAKFIVPGV